MPPAEVELTDEPVRVQLLRVADCPMAEQVRTTLHECLRETRTPVLVEDLEGPYPSPTVLVNGVDVVTGTRPSGADAYCRLDPPTREHILNALQRRLP